MKLQILFLLLLTWRIKPDDDDDDDDDDCNTRCRQCRQITASTPIVCSVSMHSRWRYLANV